jgi:hypothetical protein
MASKMIRVFLIDLNLSPRFHMLELGMLVHTCNPSYSPLPGGRDRRIMNSKATQAKLARPCLKKQNTNKRAGGMAQEVQSSVPQRKRKYVPSVAVSRSEIFGRQSPREWIDPFMDLRALAGVTLSQ